MAAVRWTTPALVQLRAELEWHQENSEHKVAATIAAELVDAAQRAGQTPEGYVWVGAIHEVLRSVSRTVRRVLTTSRRHVVYYRYDPAIDEVYVVAIRGTAQLPPTPAELGQPR